MRKLAPLAFAASLLLGCSGADPSVDESSEEVNSGVSCSESADTAYNQGAPSQIKVIRIDGKAISKTTGHAFLKMREAAKKAGESIALNSAFRTNAEQKYLYGCHQSKQCNNGNLAARPGFSNHQNGFAVDVSTSRWLAANAPKFGFVRTVPSEDWHWEYHGKDPGGPCGKGSGADAGGDDPPVSKDAGTSPQDAGTPKDAGTSRADAGTRDAGSPMDAGSAADAATPEPATPPASSSDHKDDEPEVDPVSRTDNGYKAAEAARTNEPSSAEATGCAAASPGNAPVGAPLAVAALLGAAILVSKRRRRNAP